MQNRAYPLRVLFWESTLKCNAYCKFCGSGCGRAEVGDELSREEICGVLRRIAEKYDASEIMINVSGGEPLMRRDLCDIMAYASSLGFGWGMVSNGTLLNEKLMRELEKSGLRTISISIDGVGKLHDEMRNFPGSYDIIINNVRRLPEISSLDTVMITTVVTKQNIDGLEALRQELTRLPVDLWRVAMVDPIGRASDNDSLLLDKEGVRRYLEFLRESRSMDLPFKVVSSCSHYLGRYDTELRDEPFRCFAGTQMASILANGDIYVCSNAPKIPELIQGNVRRDDFTEVWEKGFEFFRNPESRHRGKCRECRYFSSCLGDSFHTWDPEAREPKFCMLDYGLEPEKKDCGTADFNTLIEKYRCGREKIRALRVPAQSGTEDRIILSPRAVSEMGEYFHKAPGAREQIAALAGHIFRDRESGEEAFLTEIERIFPIPCEEATEDKLPADRGMILKAEKLAGENKLQALGFVHSHPGELKISMSREDIHWQRILYNEDWKMALNVIVNPERGEIAAYAGPGANHAEVILLLP